MALRGRKPLQNAAILFHAVSLSTEKSVIYLFTVWYAVHLKKRIRESFVGGPLTGEAAVT